MIKNLDISGWKALCEFKKLLSPELVWKVLIHIPLPVQEVISVEEDACYQFVPNFFFQK